MARRVPQLRGSRGLSAQPCDNELYRVRRHRETQWQRGLAATQQCFDALEVLGGVDPRVRRGGSDCDADAVSMP